MKKIGKIIKNNLFGFIMGIVLCGGVGIVLALTGTDITYTTSHNTNVTNVKGALDDLYTKANTWLNPSNMQSVSYKYWNKGLNNNTSTGNHYMGSVPTYATATAPSGSSDSAWIRTTVDSSGKGIVHETCLYLGSTGKLFCMPRNAWTNLGFSTTTALCAAMDQALGATHTSVYANSSGVYCYFGSAYCRAYSYGSVLCRDGSSYCLVSGSGYAICS